MGEPIDEDEILELRAILDLVASQGVDDPGKGFIAQLIGTKRLIAAQAAANDAMLKAQDQSHREMLEEQRTLVTWQKGATIATVLMVIITGIYAVETAAIVSSSGAMAKAADGQVKAAQEQVTLMREQMHEANRPRLFVDPSSSYSVGQFENIQPSGFPVEFEIVNKSVPAAYNIKCTIRIIKEGRQIASHIAGCRDTLFHDYQDGPSMGISADQLRAIAAPSKGSFSGIEANVTYEDASKGGSKYYAIRRVKVVTTPQNGFYLTPDRFESN